MFRGLWRLPWASRMSAKTVDPHSEFRVPLIRQAKLWCLRRNRPSPYTLHKTKMEADWAPLSKDSPVVFMGPLCVSMLRNFGRIDCILSRGFSPPLEPGPEPQLWLRHADRPRQAQQVAAQPYGQGPCNSYPTNRHLACSSTPPVMLKAEACQHLVLTLSGFASYHKYLEKQITTMVVHVLL